METYPPVQILLQKIIDQAKAENTVGHPHYAHPQWGLWVVQLAKGEFPHPEVIAVQFINNEKVSVPESIRLYIYGILSGRIKRPRGRPVLDPFDRVCLRAHVELSYAVWEEMGPDEPLSRYEGPRDWILKKVAGDCHISEGRVRDIIERKNGWEV